VAGARHFRELACWQLSNDLKIQVYRFVDASEARKDLRFRDQIRNAAASAPRNIAEGFGRRTGKDFAHFLDIARGSLMECQNHLQDAKDRGYLADADLVRMNSLAQRACGAVAALQRYLRKRSDD
jgi:four helix bundle protein